MYWASQSVKNWFFLAGQLGMETYNSQPVHIEWNDTVTGPSANNSYNSILAKLGWPINNGELSSQLAGQHWVKSLKGLWVRAKILMNLSALLQTLLSRCHTSKWFRVESWTFP